MNITIISILTTISILFSMINASGQTCPNKNLQLQMQKEETAFLANMKPGLQHTQMLAVRDAMKGDYSALEQIRQSRNQAPLLPETVETKYITPDICLFSPVNATERKRPLLLLSSWRRMVLRKHKQLCPLLCGTGRSRGLLCRCPELSAGAKLSVSYPIG